MTVTTQADVEVLAPTDLHVSDRGILDFGSVPAGEYMPEMKFMAETYEAGLYIANRGTVPLVLSRIAITDTKSDEPDNPFSTCGVPFDPYEVPPGMSLELAFCFHPSRVGSSEAVVQIYGTGEEIVATIPIRGKGRELGAEEIPPMGLVPPPGHFKDDGGAGAVDIENGRMIERGTGKDVTLRGEPRKGANCTVDIVGGGEAPNPAVFATSAVNAINIGNVGIDPGTDAKRINVGEHVILDISIVCPDGTAPRPTAVEWTIGGDAIRDYDETLSSGTLTETKLERADLIVTPRDFYWKNVGTHTVKCKVDYTWNAPVTATVERDFVVERNGTDINRQMEDFYVWNHEARVLKGHFAWHIGNPAGRCRSRGGADFFEFHRKVLGSANGFRAAFGYPAVAYWDGTQALPVSPDSLHLARAPRLPVPFPGFLTRAGRPGVISFCKKATNLASFRTATDLAEEIEGGRGWHSVGHGRVGGEMRGLNTSPKDPIFYRWHRAIDVIYHNWRLIVLHHP